MLFSIDDLRERLDGQSAHSRFDLSDMRLVEPGAPTEVVRTAEEQLGVQFPSEFARLLKRFDFSQLNLANLIFEYGHNLEKLIKANRGHPLPWWGAGRRPLNFLLIGTTDGHAIFLSIQDGRVFASEKGAGGQNNQTWIAENFEELVRLAGSLALGHSKDERVRIASTLTAHPFWTQLADGTA
jgi:SMI1-KNR4 cell-wall